MYNFWKLNLCFIEIIQDKVFQFVMTIIRRALEYIASQYVSYQALCIMIAIVFRDKSVLSQPYYFERQV